ncbi:MAG TPA: hypothetical protein IAB96_01185 [Candidatus Coprenecus pullicola]|jgi:hypothetical protein|nr:hypothetical protein [Candidatus Coprenecus pullicola]
MKIKQVLFAAAAAVLLVYVSLAVTSCESDASYSSLAGTDWYQNAGNGIEVYMHFGDVEMDFEYLLYGENYETSKYEYTFDGRGCRMTAKTYGKADLYGIVSGSTMTVTNMSNGVEIGVFYRR